ncbi:MAG: CPBP family intramembrane metalloprotease [Deltaproteobacteria bacterium]|nr:CPBP family intramembrane metalloprotease [Deltaproteobacteria bacterium]
MNKKLLFWLLGLTFLLLVSFKISQFFLPESWAALLLPALLLYVPFIYLSAQKRQIDFLDRSWKQFAGGLFAFAVAVLIIFPVYFVFAHTWMLHIFHFHGFQSAPWTAFTNHLGFQFLAVAIPEEFYFRGFLQGELNNVWTKKWRILGVDLGWSWIVTAAVFAFAHSLIQLQWWHFSIFFPALLFGYLKERTGSITAPILFHVFSNCFMDWFSHSYF